MAQSMESTLHQCHHSVSSDTLVGQVITCPSAEPHAVTDHLVHYMGCIEYCEREAYFTNLDEASQKEIKLHFRRINHLRNMLNKSKDEMRFVERVKSSIAEWRDIHLNDFDKVRMWRKTKNKKNMDIEDYHDLNTHPDDRSMPIFSDDYDPDHDIKAHFIEYRNGKRSTDSSPPFTGAFPDQKLSIHDLLYNRTSNPLSRKWQGNHNGGQDESKGAKKCETPNGTFEEVGRTNGVSRELGDTMETTTREGDAKSEKLEKNAGNIRYFHLPSNNMKWVQDAIARYFDEWDQKSREKTEKLLHHDYWRGQEYGKDSDVIHSRHLRPLCELVSSDPNELGSPAENLVLFMPYLHWESDHQRARFASFVDEASERQRVDLAHQEIKDWRQRRKERDGLHTENSLQSDPQNAQRNLRMQDVELLGESHKTSSSSFFSFTSELIGSTSRNWQNIKPQGPRKKDGRVIARYKLGQLLYDAFVLYKTLDNYRDRQLVNKYLFEEPSLHARRTLDQAYHWTLRRTKTRDQDQVVYRETNTHPSKRHRYLNKAVQPEGNDWAWNCPEDGTRHHGKFPYNLEQNQGSSTSTPTFTQISSQSLTLPTSEPRRQSDTSTKEPLPSACSTCREHIKKEPRVIMVDQLWMWILNHDTIITAFPRRYGMNRRDTTGLHKNIRHRLSKNVDRQIKSAYDLALIILQECSNTFFDRTKIEKSKPQILDIFSVAIGNMAQKQTIAFDHLWERAPQLVKNPSESLFDQAVLHRWLLDITHEGGLQRETKDIIEELDMMIFITDKQKEVLRRFEKHSRSQHSRFKHSLPQSHPSLEAEMELASRSSESGCSSRTDMVDSWSSNKAERVSGFLAPINNEVLLEIDDHHHELTLLRQRAESVCQSIGHLLALKQQQASVVQARQAIQQGEEAVRQGRSIMIFTVITIVFLPLAFMAAIFGMNNDLLKDDKMSFMKQMKFMFGISAAVIIVVLFIAFSSFFRVVIWAICYFSTSWILVRTGLYTIWLNIPERFHSQGLVRWTNRAVDKMKQETTQENTKRKALRYARVYEKIEKERKEKAGKKLRAEQEKSRKRWMLRQGPPSSASVATKAIDGHGG